MMTPILDAGLVAKTVSELSRRINERFPESGLKKVCQQLESIANQTMQRVEDISKPIWWVGASRWALVVLVFVLCVVLPLILKSGFTAKDLSWKSVMELGDPVLNEIIVIGALFFFIFTLERRVKRSRALKAIHELRSIAHVIDMHQLTKDPERVMPGKVYLQTPQSPKETLDPFLLRRYLDYCSEMLSLTGKLAAVYVQNFDDEVALSAVNEVESLTTGLSRKIWQKIVMLHNAELETLSPPMHAPNQNEEADAAVREE